MNRAMTGLALVSALALTVAGCGGGGGGGNGVVAAVAGGNTTAADVAVSDNGNNGNNNTGGTVVSRSVGAAFTVDAFGVMLDDSSRPGGQDLASDYRPGRSQITLDAEGTMQYGGGELGPITMTRDPDSETGVIELYDSATGGAVIVSSIEDERTGGVDRLSNAHYGLVAAVSGGSIPRFELHGIHGGSNPTTNMPGNVTATYSGSFAGYSLNEFDMDPEGMDELVGDASVTANFGTGQVTGRIDNIRTSVSAGDNLISIPHDTGIAMSGTISGNGYTGTASYTGNGFTTSEGNLSGGFYGNGAAETSGALTVIGRDGFGAGERTTVGAFGAKKN